MITQHKWEKGNGMWSGIGSELTLLSILEEIIFWCHNHFIALLNCSLNLAQILYFQKGGGPLYFALHVISIQHWQIYFQPYYWWSKKTGRCCLYSHYIAPLLRCVLFKFCGQTRSWQISCHGNICFQLNVPTKYNWSKHRSWKRHLEFFFTIIGFITSKNTYQPIPQECYTYTE